MKKSKRRKANRKRRLYEARKSRAFYKMRRQAAKTDGRDDAEALSAWRGWGVALATFTLIALAMFAAALAVK